jgi:hypothetical protein
MDQKTQTLLYRLKVWFVIHFIADIITAIPLFLFPVFFLKMLGWQAIDPLATRLVAAALFGIGIESYLGRNGDLRTFGHMLNLKIIWSAAAVLGIFWSMLHGIGVPFLAQGIVLLIFLFFHGIWVYFKIQVKRMSTGGSMSS